MQPNTLLCSVLVGLAFSGQLSSAATGGTVVGIKSDFVNDVTSLYFVDPQTGKSVLFKQYSPSLHVNPANVVVDQKNSSLIVLSRQNKYLVAIDLVSGKILSNATLEFDDLTGLALDPVYGLTAYRFDDSSASLPFGTINVTSGRFVQQTKIAYPELVPAGFDPQAHVRYFAYPSPPYAEYFQLDLQSHKLKILGQSAGFPFSSFFLPSTGMIYGLSPRSATGADYDVFAADPIASQSIELNIIQPGQCWSGTVTSSQAFDPVTGNFWLYANLVQPPASVLYQVDAFSRSLVRTLDQVYDAVAFW
eukprot:TRINITY_DN18924_c0_g1_i1.p1 TRINITY_DN18924_c0_g1~~TRINITY_DN18924_c0_g1_i1.p1  ORF type:complete len:305 (-),score=57.51 TRINITY_DN18924_c0_g1_i1:34-948(-)